MLAKRIKQGIAAALFVFAANVFFEATTYLYGCTVYGGGKCSVSEGFYWIRHHPVFSHSIWDMTAFGFVFGVIFGIRLASAKEVEAPRSLWQKALPFLIAIPLIIAFVLWGIPEIPPLYRAK